MTTAEKKTRIETIKDTIFRINVGSDFLTHEQHNHLTDLYNELRRLENEVKAEG